MNEGGERMRKTIFNMYIDKEMKEYLGKKSVEKSLSRAEIVRRMIYDAMKAEQKAEEKTAETS